MTKPFAFPQVDIALSESPDRLRDLTVLSPALGRRADVTVYAAAGAADVDSLPVVILLHGVYGSHWAWARSGFAHVALADLVTAGQVAPMVLAMPSDGMFGIGSGYLDRAGENAERWIVQEVPEAVRLVHPTAALDDVSIAGLSMGGWGALRLAALHPGRFRAAVGMSPLTRVAHVADYAPIEMRARHAPRVELPELLDALVAAGSRLPPVRITCGIEDELITDVRRLHDGLSAAGIPHEYAEGPGGHSWDYWTQDVRTALRFIDRVRSGALLGPAARASVRTRPGVAPGPP